MLRVDEVRIDERHAQGRELLRDKPDFGQPGHEHLGAPRDQILACLAQQRDRAPAQIAGLDAIGTVHRARHDVAARFVIGPWMQHLVFRGAKVPFEERALANEVRRQHADAARVRKMAAHVREQTREHIHDLDSRVPAQFVDIGMAHEARQHDSRHPALFELANRVVDVKLALDARNVGRCPALARMLLEDHVEMIAVARRGRRLDQFEKHIGGGQCAEPADHANYAEGAARGHESFRRTSLPSPRARAVVARTTLSSLHWESPRMRSLNSARMPLHVSRQASHSRERNADSGRRVAW